MLRSNGEQVGWVAAHLGKQFWRKLESGVRIEASVYKIVDDGASGKGCVVTFVEY
jgi:hypothetical protein